jgi:hypothetical protein
LGRSKEIVNQYQSKSLTIQFNENKKNHSMDNGSHANDGAAIEGCRSR